MGRVLWVSLMEVGLPPARCQGEEALARSPAMMAEWAAVVVGKAVTSTAVAAVPAGASAAAVVGVVVAVVAAEAVAAARLVCTGNHPVVV